MSPRNLTYPRFERRYISQTIILNFRGVMSYKSKKKRICKNPNRLISISGMRHDLDLSFILYKHLPSGNLNFTPCDIFKFMIPETQGHWKAHLICQGSLNDYHFGGNQPIHMAILRDFPYNNSNALFGFVSYNDPCVSHPPKKSTNQKGIPRCSRTHCRMLKWNSWVGWSMWSGRCHHREGMEQGGTYPRNLDQQILYSG